MKIRTLTFATAAAIVSVSAVPAAAAPILFELSGSRNATFTIDSNTPPTTVSSSALIGDQVSFSNVAGTFNGTPGSATVGFGTGLAADLNILSPSLGFTQFSSVNDLFSLVNSRPVFNFGTFSLTSIVSGSSTLRISAAMAAVPEPATWAMMMVGFGGVGFALRRRKVKTTVAYA